MSPDYKYDENFRAQEKLSDGSNLIIRLIRPDDKPLLARGLAELSPQSKYLRFFTPKAQLSSRELAYLTEIDGVTHFAIIGFRRQEGETYGAGIARFVRDANDATVAEPAIVVLDRFQSMGIGKKLLYHLHLAAFERGIRWFECEFLAENKVMRNLLEGFSEDAKFEAVDSETIWVRLPVLNPDGDIPKISETVMAQSAKGGLRQTLKRMWHK